MILKKKEMKLLKEKVNINCKKVEESCKATTTTGKVVLHPIQK